MNIKIENFFLFFVVVADFTRTVSSFDSKCPPLKVVNGRSKYRWRGRSVRFSCMRGYQLVGVKYAICMNGKWDGDVPICVKPGCRAPSTTHVNGQFLESYRGAVVKIVCNPGYTLIGSPSVYCNGFIWNETFPVCRVKDSNPALSCDFEDPNLCGWSQDPMHDFDWKRQNGSTPSGDTGTGPTFDHTRENSTGYYMYLESSSPRLENDEARLYSPVYPPEYSNGTCFKFWYHIYGTTTGFLKVYVKPEGVELSSLIPSFWIIGEQGKFWIESFFHVEPVDSPFQIVIEGVRGHGAGDTAFDDVKLTSADECKILEEMTSSTEYSTSDSRDDDTTELGTCENRCGQEKGNDTGTEEYRCYCHESCERDGICCSDYFEFCYQSSSTESTTENHTRTSTSTSEATTPSKLPEKTTPSKEPEKATPPKEQEKTTPPKEQEKTTPPKQPENELPSFPAKPSHPVHYNNESNDIVPLPVHPTHNRTSNEIRKPENPPEVSKATTPRPRPETPAVKDATPPKKKFPKEETTKTKAAAMPANSSNEIPRRKALPKVGGKANGKAVTLRSTSATPSDYETTARAFKNSKPNNIKLTILEKPSSPNLSNEFRFNKEVSGKEPPQAIKIDKSEEIIQVGLAVVAVLIVVILGIVCYKRREHRKAERENMVEDSDSIVYKMDSSTLESESHSLICIRPGGLRQSL